MSETLQEQELEKVNVATAKGSQPQNTVNLQHRGEQDLSVEEAAEWSQTISFQFETKVTLAAERGGGPLRTGVTEEAVGSKIDRHPQKVGE